VEDIHQLSFKPDTFDAVFCIAVLEHVYDPKKAAEEIVRVLKPGGAAFVYVPFLYRYHAHASDYNDYFRYTKDGIAYLFRGCRHIEVCPVGGLFESLLKTTPLYRLGICRILARLLDESTARMRRIGTVQTSGYHVYIEK
jgi:ubiquinone/menaquinone biosynthesis C-methylase UbiE